MDKQTGCFQVKQPFSFALVPGTLIRVVFCQLGRTGEGRGGSGWLVVGTSELMLVVDEGGQEEEDDDEVVVV